MTRNPLKEKNNKKEKKERVPYSTALISVKHVFPLLTRKARSFTWCMRMPALYLWRATCIGYGPWIVLIIMGWFLLSACMHILSGDGWNDRSADSIQAPQISSHGCAPTMPHGAAGGRAHWRAPPPLPAERPHTALVCKCWCRSLAAAGSASSTARSHFVLPPVPNASAHPPPSSTPLDSRHGCVLLGSLPLPGDPSDTRLAVLDPITGELPRRQRCSAPPCRAPGPTAATGPSSSSLRAQPRMGRGMEQAHLTRSTPYISANETDSDSKILKVALIWAHGKSTRFTYHLAPLAFYGRSAMLTTQRMVGWYVHAIDSGEFRTRLVVEGG